jgi:hypothetical protein
MSDCCVEKLFKFGNDIHVLSEVLKENPPISETPMVFFSDDPKRITCRFPPILCAAALTKYRCFSKLSDVGEELTRAGWT